MFYQVPNTPRIVLIAGIILIIVTVLSGTAIYFAMEKHAKETQRVTLQLSLEGKVDLMESEIDIALDRAKFISTNPLLLTALESVNADMNNMASRILFNKAARALVGEQYRAVALYNDDGVELTRAGSFSKRQKLVVPVNILRGSAELLWDKQILLRSVMYIKSKGQIVGKLISESFLPATMASLNNSSTEADPRVLALCADLPTNSGIQCFPNQSHSKVFTTPYTATNGAPLPTALALGGDTGFIITNDYREQQVSAAYSPVGDSGLGMVLKENDSKLFEHIWMELAYVLPFMTILLIVALFLLRWLLRPLVVNLTAEIAERKHAQQMQSESEAILLSTVDTTLDGVIHMDSAAIITGWNRQAEHIFGWSRTEALSQVVFDMITPQRHRVAHAQALKHFLATGEGEAINKRTEMLGMRRDGSVLPLEGFIAPLDVTNKVLFSFFIRDITQQKKSAKQIKKGAENLAQLHKQQDIIRNEADKAKSEFISTISHELRTPLTSIKGALGLIKGGVFDNNAGKITPIAEIAYNNTERLHHLIDEILDIEKLEAGVMSFNLQSMDLSALVKESVALNAGYGKQHNVELVYLGSNEDLLVYGDANRLEQVMGNLLSNAAKFSTPGSQVEVDVERHEGSLRITVTDFGRGIPLAARATIFDKFTQADSSDKRQKGGSGLGLSIAKMIVEAHDGRINFTTEEGKGTTFYVNLSELGNMTSRLTPSLRVLMVDDQELVVQGISTLISLEGRGLGIQVVGTAGSAKEAIAQVHILRPDLVLMDMHMPDISGSEAVLLIKQQLPNTKILMLSGFASAEDVALAKKAGADGYSHKSDSPTALVEDISKVMSSRHFFVSKYDDNP